MSGKQPEWLATTVDAVRDLMRKRIAGTLDDEARRDAEIAVRTLDLLWEQLEGEAELLKREHQRYCEFFDNAPDAFIVTDSGASVREANRAALELLGKPLEELRGRSLAGFLPDAERADFLMRVLGLISAPAPASWRTRLLRAGHAPVAVQIGVRPIPLARSGVGGLCWVVRPIP